MNTLSFIIAIIGLALTIYGIYISIRKKNYPGNIYFAEINSIDLFNTIVKNFEQIKILFEEKAISENVVFLKAALINIGEIDIEEEKVEEKISITLPEGFLWINVQITSHSPDLKCEPIVNENKLTINTGLFRRNEYLMIESLVQVAGEGKPTQILAKAMSFHHRIAETMSIKRHVLPPTSAYIPFKKAAGAYILLFAVSMMLVCVVTLAPYSNGSRSIEYLTKDTNGTLIKVTVDGREGDSVLLSNENEKFKKVMSLSEFRDSSYRPEIVVAHASLDEKIRITIYIGIGILLLLCWYHISTYRKFKTDVRVRSILGMKL